jgi:outer membrane protein OmpA-like peptidoglycan-associated protein
MTRQLASAIVCGVAVLASACATKSFVQAQLSAAETRLAQRVDIQETKLREASDRAEASHQAIEAGERQLKDLDLRVGEVGALAGDAKNRADLVAEVARNAELRLSQRFADRNKYRELETRFINFDFDRTDIREQGLSELAEVAKALKADANAVVELQGFADPRGSDRYNYELARERVEAVIGSLVQRYGVELRQIRAVGLGKVALAAGEKTNTEALAKTRRVDIRLLAPWSSWEDAQEAQINQPASEQTATVNDVGADRVGPDRRAPTVRERAVRRRDPAAPARRLARLDRSPEDRLSVAAVTPTDNPVPKLASLTFMGLGVAFLSLKRWPSVKPACPAPLAWKPTAGRVLPRATTSRAGSLHRTARGRR